MPSYIPISARRSLKKLSGLDYPEVAFTVLKRLIGNEIDQSESYGHLQGCV